MNKEKLIQKTDIAIAELVKDKTEIRKAYNYYNCVMDKELYKFLEENYGIGQPTSVEFIPLIKKHVDALVGEYLDLPILPKISCKDEETISNIYRDKQLYIVSECYKLLEKNLKNNLLRILGSLDMIDLNIKEQLDNLINSLNNSFVSEYEKAGQHIVEYIILSRAIDLRTKLKLLILDLLISGFTFFQVEPSSSNKNISIRCLSPLDTFPELNYNSPYINESPRIVIRTYLTRNEILNKYGNDLSKEDRAKIREMWQEHLYDDTVYYVRGGKTLGLRSEEAVTPGQNEFYYDNTHIPVYEVEWLEADNKNIMLRYKTIRIGSEIYILKGKDENIIRSKDFPERATLSVNGVWFNNRGDKPYSMVIGCMSLLDKYNLLHFFRDNLIASSGTVGDFINLPTLPTILGSNLAERLMKWKAYKKEGLALIDTSQEGQISTGLAPLNTLVNGYDDTIKVTAIQAIQLAIDSVELTVSSITGVFRERLNGIQQRDAVTNVQTGINNSFIVTKQWHFQMDLVLREILLDSLNCAKLVYPKGITGTLILGNKYQEIFTALPKYYTITDFDIHLITSSDVIQEMELIKALIPDFIKGNLISADIIMDIITSKSLTDMKSKVKQAMKVLKEENNLMQQLTQQVEQLSQQLKQSESQLQQALQKIETLNEAKLQIEKLKIQLLYEIDTYKARTERTFKEAQAENDTKRTQIEYMLLYDGNPYNDEVKNI